MALHVVLKTKQVNGETHSTARGDRVVLQVREKNGRFAGSRVDLTSQVHLLLSR